MKNEQHLNLKAEGQAKQAITFPITISDHYVKEISWKLDREIWSKVPNPNVDFDGAYSQSKAREESSKLIIEYLGSVDDLKGKIKRFQRALDIAKEALYLVRGSDPAFNSKTRYSIDKHEIFGELLRNFLEIEDQIRSTN